MRRILLFSLLLAGCASQSRDQGLGYEAFYSQNVIAVGTIDVLDLQGSSVSEVSLSPPFVAELVPMPDPRHVGIRMLREGTAVVTVQGKPGEGNRQKTYNVISGTLSHELGAVAALLEGIPGIQVGVFNGVVKISGELRSPKTVIRDYDRIYQAEKLFVCLNTVTIADSLYDEAAVQMQREVEKLDGASKVKVRVLNGTFVLEGDTASLSAREKAEALVTTLLPPMKASPAIQENALVLGAKKWSVRNLIQVNERAPASACPKN